MDVYINTTYNSSIFDNPPAKREVAIFVYYDKRLPPDVTRVVPPHVPLAGRAISFAGGDANPFAPARLADEFADAALFVVSGSGGDAGVSGASRGGECGR